MGNVNVNWETRRAGEASKNNTPTEIWTRVAGFKVQSANHYTIGALLLTPSRMLLLLAKFAG